MSRLGDYKNSVLYSKLLSALNEKDSYTAHQLYKTINFRLMNFKRYDECQDLLLDGIKALIDLGQYNSALDLCKSFRDLLIQSKIVTLDYNLLHKISTIHKWLADNYDARQEFSCMMLKWSSKFVKSSKQYGSPQLHAEFAHTFWQEGNYEAAFHHFIRSCDGESCARLIIELHLTRGYPSEFDIFVSQAVLQYLALNQLETANICYETYVCKHPIFSKMSYRSTPLINFLFFLIEAIKSRNANLFLTICNVYKPSLNRDSTYAHYIDCIGETFFGLTASGKPKSGGISKFLKDLFDKVDDSPNTTDSKTPNSLPIDLD